MSTDDRRDAMIVEKRPISIWNLIAFAATIAVTAFGWGITYNTAVSNDARAQDQISGLSDDVKDIKAQLPQLPQMQLQINSTIALNSENKSKIEEVSKNTNARVDRIVDQFGDKLDKLVTNINELKTQVGILASQATSDKERKYDEQYMRRNSH